MHVDACPQCRYASRIHVGGRSALVGHGRGGGVCLGVGTQLPGETKVDFAQDILAWIFGPHAGEDMHDVAEVSLHGVIIDSPAVNRQCSKSRPIQKIWR